MGTVRNNNKLGFGISVSKVIRQLLGVSLEFTRFRDLLSSLIGKQLVWFWFYYGLRLAE